jgi:DNA-binding transcriptional regulator YiaG
MATATKAGKDRRRTPNKERAAEQPVPLREEYGLTRKTLARMTGLSERTLATWEGGARVNEAGLRALNSVKRLLEALAEVMRKEAIADWLEKPNEGFGGLKPLEVIERGEADRLWRMMYFLGSGTVS